MHIRVTHSKQILGMQPVAISGLEFGNFAIGNAMPIHW
jgi:hypothetical protein